MNRLSIAKKILNLRQGLANLNNSLVFDLGQSRMIKLLATINLPTQGFP